MRGNNREIQRQMIENRIIVEIDRKRLVKSRPKRAPEKIISMFDYLKGTQPAEAFILGRIAGIV